MAAASRGSIIRLKLPWKKHGTASPLAKSADRPDAPSATSLAALTRGSSILQRANSILSCS